MDTMHHTAKQELRSYIERIERLEEEKAALASDVKDLKVEMKSKGYDMKAVAQILRERKKDADEVRDLESIVAVYRDALGMLDGTPLGDAAIVGIRRAA